MITEAELAALADAAIIHLAADPELMSALMGASGLDPAQLRQAAERPELAAALLDFLCETDQRLFDFARSAGIRAERIAYARAALEAGQVGIHPR